MNLVLLYSTIKIMHGPINIRFWNYNLNMEHFFPLMIEALNNEYESLR